MNIQEIRQKYPEYSDLTDKQIADGFHQKYYSDVPVEEFYAQIGLKPLTGRQRARDFGMSVASVAPGAASIIAGLPGDLDALGKSFLPEFMTTPIRELVTGKETDPMYIPGSQDIKNYMTTKAEGRPLAQEIINYQPQTAPGRYTKTVGEFAAPGLMAKTKAARQFGTGLGAGGGLLFEGTKDLTGSPGAATAVTIPTMIAAGLLGKRNTAQQLADEALSTTTADDIAQATALEQTANQLGIKLLPGELINDKSIQSLTRDVIRSERGSPAVYQATKGRDAAVVSASEAQASKLGAVPGSVRKINQMIESTIGIAKQNARRERSLRANFMGYGNLKGAKLQEGQVQKVIDIIDNEMRMAAPGGPRERILKQLKSRITIPVKESDEVGILLADGTPANPLQATKNYKPQTNINKLDETFQEFRDRARYEPGTADAIDKKTWNSLFNQDETGVLNELNKAMRTNVDYRNANDVYALLSDELVAVVDRNLPDLTKAGITATNVKSFVFDPTKANVADIRKTYEILNKTNPNAFPQMANLYFRNAMDKAFTAVKNGEDLTKGFNLAKEVMGTGNKRQNFMAILDGVADAKGVDAKQLKVGFEKLFDVLERTGRVTNINNPGFLAEGAAARSVAKDAAMMKTFNPLVRLATKYGEYKSGRAWEELGKLFQSDDAVNQLVAMSRTNPQSQEAIIRAVNIIDSTQALTRD